MVVLLVVLQDVVFFVLDHVIRLVLDTVNLPVLVVVIMVAN